MTTANLTTFDSMLKYVYLPNLNKQFYDKTVLSSRIKRASKKDIVHNKAVIAMVTTRHQGHGARAEDTDLPTAGNVGYAIMTPPIRSTYGRMRITGQAMRAATGDRRAYIRGVRSEVMGCAEGVAHDVNFQWNQDGSGLLTTCGTTAGSATCSVSHTRYLEVGMVVDVKVKSTGDTSTGVAAATITAVDADNNTFTTASSVTTDSTFGVYLSGTRNIVMQGVRGICDNRNPADIQSSGVATLQGLDVATATYWKATRSVGSSVNRDISVDILRAHFDTIDQTYGNLGEKYILYSRHGQFRKFGNLLIVDRRYQGNGTKFEGGFETLTFEGREWFYDRDCEPNCIYTLNTDHLRIFEMSPPTWAEEDGSILSRVADRDAYEAFMYYDAELGTDARFAHGQIQYLSE